MIKVLHIIPSLKKGGAERLCLDICNALAKQDGVKVKLITFSDKNEYPFLTDSIHWEIVAADIKLSVVRHNKCSVSALQAAFNEFRPDIIHTHLFEAEIVSRSCNYPDAVWFSHCHDNMIQFRNLEINTIFKKSYITDFYEKLYLLNRYKINGGNHFIAISKDTEAYFKKTAKHYEVTLLANAIDYHKFYNPHPGKKPGDVLRLINIGSFVEKKNQGFLLKIANILKKRSVPFELHLLGDGVKKTELEIKAKNLGLGKEVIFHGLVERVEEILWRSNVYVHSATYEPLGLVLLEAMAAGLPVITLDGKGNRDLIVEGKNGYMIYEQDAELFAQTIIDLWYDRQKYAEMSRYTQEYAKQYDIAQYVDALMALYSRAIEEKNKKTGE